MKVRLFIFQLCMILVVLVLLAIPVVALASDISSAIYSGVITISNNGTAVTNGVAVLMLNSQSLIDVYGVDTAFDYTAVRNSSGADVRYGPSVNSTYPWCFFMPSLGDYASTNYILYTGNSSLNATRYYFPGAAGMTVADNDTMEWGSSGNLSFTAWLDTTAGGNFTTHHDTAKGGIVISNPASGQVQVNVSNIFQSNLSFDGGDYANKAAGVVAPSGTNMTIEGWFYFDAIGGDEVLVFAGDYTAWNFFMLSKNATNHIVFAIGNVGNSAYACSYASTNACLAATWYNITATYNADAATEPHVYVNGAEWGGADAGDGTNIWQASGNLTLGARETTGVFSAYLTGDMDEIRISNIARTSAEAIAAYNGGVGIGYSVDANTLALYHLNTGSGTTATDETGNNNLSFGAGVAAPSWATTTPVIGLQSTSVSVSSITSGEYDLSASLAANILTLTVGATTNTTACTHATGNSTANWTFFANSSVLYMESANFSKGGVPVSAWEWEYDTIFHDSIGANDGTPSFRTTASDADITASLVSFTPLSTAIAPAFSVSAALPFYTSNITASSNFTSSNVSVPGGGPPGVGLIEDIADASDTPLPWIWGILAMTTITFSSFGVDYMQKRYGFRSLWPKIFIGVVVIGLLITFGKFDWWMMVMYGFIVLALAIASRHTDVGGSVSQHGLIGFLAQSWIGLTIINRIIEGQLITSSEQTWSNYYAFTQEFRLFDIFSLPVINLDFFTHGIPSLIKWDYSFFGGNAQMIQYLLYSITAVVAFIIFLAIVPLVYNFFKSIL